MKIAITFPAIHRRGGVERIALECANFLARRGHEVFIFCARSEKSAIDPRITIVHVPSHEKQAVPRLLSFARLSRRKLNSYPSIEAVGAFGVQSPRGVYWAQSVHSAWIEISASRRNWKGRILQKLNPMHPLVLRMEKHVYGGRRYDKVVALTPDVKADLQKFYDVPESDILVIPNGFSPAEFNCSRRSTERNAQRQKLGLTPDNKTIIFVANELERKGFGPLLRAIAQLDDDSIHLLAVGKLSKESYIDEIERLKMSERVHFTGPTSDAGAFFAAADVFALPTQYEAWGLVIVEALASGLPVVTSRLAGASVAVKEGETGFLLDNPDDVNDIATKLRTILSRSDWNAEQISRSVAHYSWDEVLIPYEAALIESAEKRR